MGGTAIGYVKDPSAVFHNPAGLQGVHGFALLGDVSAIFANFSGSPVERRSLRSTRADLIILPFFLAAVAYRPAEWLTLGLGGFPVASGGADYEYPTLDGPVYELNSARVAFFEVTPVLSLNIPKDALLPGELAFGIGYRATLTTFERQLGDPADPRGLDLSLRGLDFKGFRAGVQYRPGRAFAIGAVYRNRVTVVSRADEAVLANQPLTDVEFPFVLPAQLGAGIRLDVGSLGAAADVVYTFQSQNDRSAVTGLIGTMPVSIPNVSDWQDAFTLHFGLEYRLGPAQDVPIRVGYIFDDRVASRRFPSAFGIPPASTNSYTFGGGYTADNWEINLALTLTEGGTEINAPEIAPAGECATCGFAGEYRVAATGVYIDFSTQIGD
jgi:long-subunit fatty acid transport protein